jgi:hypothetical protein
MKGKHWWNDTDGEKSMYSEKKLTQCRIVWHKSYMDWPGIETGLPWGAAGE